MVTTDIYRRETGWDNDSNESSRPSQNRPGAESRDQSRSISHQASYETYYDEAGYSFTRETENDFGHDRDTLNYSNPISFDCSNSSWLYTIRFALTWLLAPVLIIISKITCGPASINVHSRVREER